MTDEHEQTGAPFLRWLRLKDYKSIGKCDIPLHSFTALVGPNGAGKSNLIDSLQFVSDALRNSLAFALLERGGINEVRRRSKGHPRFFGMGLDMTLPGGSKAYFAFQIGRPRAGAYSVSREVCHVSSPDAKKDYYDVREGELGGSSLEMLSAIEADRLYLQAVSAVPQFRPVYNALTRMGFYNLNPDMIRDLQDPDPAELLAPHGENMASILRQLESTSPAAKRRIEEYLGVVDPGVRGVAAKPIGPKATIEFRQVVAGDERPWRFLAANMSDGTLRALGVLVAIFQGASGPGQKTPLVGIEEPESALHPGATNALAGAILEASAHTQVLVTSHSPDMLDSEEISSESILAVISEKGETIVGPVNTAAKEALRDSLYTAGELLRIQQIEPDRTVFRNRARQLQLFPREVST